MKISKAQDMMKANFMHLGNLHIYCISTDLLKQFSKMILKNLPKEVENLILLFDQWVLNKTTINAICNVAHKISDRVMIRGRSVDVLFRRKN